MKNGLIEFIIVMLLFFAGTGSLLFIDGICFETTGEGGNLVLDIDKLNIFH